MKFNIPTNDNQKLAQIVDNIKQSAELEGYLEAANVNAVERLKYSDHGSTHIKIVANAGLKIFRILRDKGVVSSIEEHHELEKEDAEVVVVLASVLHDIGMIVHRHQHDLMSVFISADLLDDLLQGVYQGKEKAIVKSEILSAIFPHDSRSKALTKEAGVVAVADALDMAEGRARIPFEEGKQDIHSVSAMAIDRVKINQGDKEAKPVQIKIEMKNSAGIFQVDELLKKKLKNSGIKDKFEIVAEISGDEESIIKHFEI